MRYIVLDTETVSINKPFVYDIGYIIADDESKRIVKTRNFLVKEVYDNAMLFETAYFYDKKPIYEGWCCEKLLKKHKLATVMEKLKADIEKYKVSYIYAYNAPFDEKAIRFTCNFLQVEGLSTVEFIDIRGVVHNTLLHDKTLDYCIFCETYNLFTEAGNYSTTAEAIGKYILKDSELIEDHTALSDSLLEYQILTECLNKYNAKIGAKYEPLRSIERKVLQYLTIKRGGKTIDSFECRGYTFDKKNNTIILK